MIAFISANQFKKGITAELLYNSYKDLITSPVIKDKEHAIREFQKFDEQVFSVPGIAKCTFITCLEGKPIGLFSFDPRHCPDFAIIGHNCIIPEYKGKGYGIKQIEEIIRILREQNCKKVIVSTGDHTFFIPAQKMYLRCGFYETKKFTEKEREYPMIEYEKNII